MKNLLYLFSGLLIICFIACKSEFTDELKTAEAQSRLSNDGGCTALQGLDRVPIYPNEFEVQELLANPNDPSDQNINYLLYTLSEAIKPLIDDCNFNSIIIEMARASMLDAASLLNLREQGPHYYDLINENLPQDLSIEKIANQLIYHNPYGMEPEQYDPGIFIPNLEIASAERQPLISAHLEYPGNEIHLEDAILGIYYDEEGEFKNTWIGEYVMDVTTNPIFVVDLLQQTTKRVRPSVNTPLEVNSNSVESQSCPIEYYFTNYSIAHRFENDNNSEYYYDSYFYLDNGARVQGNGDLIKKIHKNDINQTHYDWEHIWRMCANYPSTERLALVTFERDGGRSPKSVFVDNNLFELNMKYSSEWYQKIVFDVDGSDYSAYTKGHVGLESLAICDDCPPGYFYDGAHCDSGMGAPPGYFTFIWGNSFYTTQNCSISTANNCCPNGFSWDTANCHSNISIPAGWQPFIWQGGFYVHPKCL